MPILSHHRQFLYDELRHWQKNRAEIMRIEQRIDRLRGDKIRILGRDLLSPRYDGGGGGDGAELQICMIDDQIEKLEIRKAKLEQKVAYIDGFLEILPEGHRTVLELEVIEQVPRWKVAEHLHVSISCVKKWKGQAMETLIGSILGILS